MVPYRFKVSLCYEDKNSNTDAIENLVHSSHGNIDACQLGNEFCIQGTCDIVPEADFDLAIFNVEISHTYHGGTKQSFTRG